MVRCSNESIEKLLQPTLIQLNLKSYKLSFSGITEKGDGYLGDITFVKVEGKSVEDGRDKTYDFVIKSGKISENLREVMPIRKAFTNEIYVYDNVLPFFKKFQQEKALKNIFNNHPKCYGTTVTENMEMLVLQNMKSLGYDVWNRKVAMPLDHLIGVVKIYAGFHATSLALKDQNPKEFEKLAGNLVDMIAEFGKAFDTDKNVKVFQDIIDIAKDKNKLDIATKVEELQDRLSANPHVAEPQDPYSVILHGDCWNNNFMFKYKEETSKEISEISLIDFQLSRVGSPVYDLSYFLFSCMSNDDVQHFDKINRIYHEELSKSLRELGSDPQKVFPYEQLLDQWSRFGVFGLMMIPSILKIELSDGDEVTDLVELADKNEDLMESFRQPVKNMEEFGRRSLGIMQLAIDKHIM